jgi:hypothetical protein
MEEFDMTATLLDPEIAGSTNSAEHLRQLTAAARVSLRWLGVRKTLTPEQKTQAAESFGAEGDFLSARKKLLDTTHPSFKAVTAVRGKILAYWKAMSLPYPEPGIRLIQQAKVAAFNQQMRDLRLELDEAVLRLDDHYEELRSAAQRRLGSLFNSADYPSSLRGHFELTWDFPSVEPPDYLLQLNPAIYEQERARVASRFEEAVQLAEQAFMEEFGKLVAHLTERLSGAENEKKVFRDSAVGNLTEFFARFKELNVRSNPDLDRLVEQAQRVVSGIRPQELRDSQHLQQQVATQLSGVQAALDGMMIDRPRRSIVRAGANRKGGPDAPAH